MAYVIDLRHLTDTPVKKTVTFSAVLAAIVVILLTTGIISIPYAAEADTTSAHYVGTAADAANGQDCTWTSVTNAQGDTTSTAATCNITTNNSNANTIRLTNFNFSDVEVPIGSQIDGVTVEVERSSSGSKISDFSVQLTTNGTSAIGGSDNKAAGTSQQTKAFQTYGGPTDDWNAGLSQADVTSSNFGVLIVYRKGTGGNETISVYRARVTIDFTPPDVAYTQQEFQWYENVDAIQPSVALAAENATATDIALGEVVRLRTNVEADTAIATATKAFKLQYAPLSAAGSCVAVPSGNFADVGAEGSGEIWRGYDNTGVTVIDGATTTNLLLTSSTNNESYEESNPTIENTNAYGAGDVGEYDFALQNNGADSGTIYCFRMVESDSTVFDSYTRMGVLRTISPLNQTRYRWRNDDGAE